MLTIVAWREAAEQKAEMTEISNSLPTRYIDAFPNHLNDIIELVEKARRKFCIMTDCVDYGSFSDPECHEHLLKIIKNAEDPENKDSVKKTHKIKVQILLCGEAEAISSSSPFYDLWKKSEAGDIASWKKLYESPKFKKCREGYFEFYKNNDRCIKIDVGPLNSGLNEIPAHAKFKEILMEHHNAVEKYLRAKSNGINEVKVYEWEKGNRESPGLFFWMQDDVEAVFLLSRTGATARGLAFRTRDATLIEIFKSTFRAKRAEAEI